MSAGEKKRQGNGAAVPQVDARAAPPASVVRPVGLVRGALVMTTRGIRPVQDILSGDLLLTRGNGVVSVRRIEQQSLVARAVYVIGGTFGHRRPDRDTLLPAGQCVLLNDWRARALGGQDELAVPAKELVDGEFVRDIGLQPMTLYRIYCAVPQIIYADGMMLGTADLEPAVVTQPRKPTP